MNGQRHVGVADADDVANLRDAVNDPDRPSGSRIELGEDFASGLLNLIDALRAVADASKDLFPPEAEIWGSRRLYRVREALIALGEDPAPNVARFTGDAE